MISILAGIGLKSDKWNYLVYLTHAIIAKYRNDLNRDMGLLPDEVGII